MRVLGRRRHPVGGVAGTVDRPVSSVLRARRAVCRPPRGGLHKEARLLVVECCTARRRSDADLCRRETDAPSTRQRPTQHATGTRPAHATTDIPDQRRAAQQHARARPALPITDARDPRRPARLRTRRRDTRCTGNRQRPTGMGRGSTVGTDRRAARKGLGSSRTGRPERTPLRVERTRAFRSITPEYALHLAFTERFVRLSRMTASDMLDGRVLPRGPRSARAHRRTLACANRRSVRRRMPTMHMRL